MHAAEPSAISDMITCLTVMTLVVLSNEAGGKLALTNVLHLNHPSSQSASYKISDRPTWDTMRAKADILLSAHS